MSVLALMLAGCASDPKTDDGAGDTAAPVTLEAPDPGGLLPLIDANNYRFQGILDGPSYPLAELADVAVDWSELTRDFQCHDLDPGVDVDNVALLVFPYLSEEEVEVGLSDDDIEQSELGVYLSVEPEDGVISAALSDFTFFGTEANIQEEFQAGSGTWLLLFTTGNTVGVGARMIAFLEPTPGEPAASVAIPDGCGVLDYTVDLGSLNPLTILPAGPWSLDWSALTEDGRGGEVTLGDIDGLMVGRYDDLSVADLEADFLDLEFNADALWTLETSGEPAADLMDLLDGEGQPFPGFEEGPTWILALRCSTCANPAPPFLTVLVPWVE